MFQLQWTLSGRYWTIRRKSALLLRSGAYARCKAAFAGRVRERRLRRMPLHARFARYGLWARVVAGRVAVPQRVTSGTPELKPAQRRALLALESEPGASLTRSEYERLTGVGRSQAACDLTELVSAGLFVRVGGGRSTRYVLAHEPASQRRWTPDRIRRELDAFCADRSVWPTASEFKAAGHGDLYVAASRYGGVAHWANELGLERLDRSRTTAAASRMPLRSRLAWSFAGASVAGAFAAAAVAAVVATHHFGPSGRTGAKASAGPGSTRRAVHESLQRPRAASTRAAAPHGQPPTRKHVTRPKVSRISGASSAAAQHTSLALEPRQMVSTQTAPATSARLAAAASHSDGPAPLPAPTGASAPSPLQAP